MRETASSEERGGRGTGVASTKHAAAGWGKRTPTLITSKSRAASAPHMRRTQPGRGTRDRTRQHNSARSSRPRGTGSIIDHPRSSPASTKPPAPRRARPTLITLTTRVHKAHDARRHQLGVHIPCVAPWRAASAHAATPASCHHPYTDEAGAYDSPPRPHATAASPPYTRLRWPSRRARSTTPTQHPPPPRAPPRRTPFHDAHSTPAPPSPGGRTTHARASPHIHTHPFCMGSRRAPYPHPRDPHAASPARPAQSHPSSAAACGTPSPPPGSIRLLRRQGTPASTARALHACASFTRRAHAPRFASVRSRVCMGPHRTLHHVRIRAHPYAAPLAGP
ncbi:hypothetical protein DFH09DRAFT_1436601 [Mycena vulgaris]|nr:hypothetical protein DFH09DRAFT_1436601 [Mycena vulgaris]